MHRLAKIKMRDAETHADLPGRLHSVAIRLLRHVRPADAEAGLSAARLSALSVLVFGGPHAITELAVAEQVTAATMSRLVTGLERDGLVTRGPDAGDGRRVRVTATRAGSEALESGRRRRVERLALLLEGVDSEGRQAVSEAVEILEGVLARTPARG